MSDQHPCGQTTSIAAEALQIMNPKAAIFYRAASVAPIDMAVPSVRGGAAGSKKSTLYFLELLQGLLGRGKCEQFLVCHPDSEGLS